MAHQENIRAVPERSERSSQIPPPAAAVLGPEQLDEETLAAARRLAEAHFEVAAELSPDSPVRALALRCGNHWARLGGPPRRGLRQMPRP